jgi:hypothetical protein
MINGMDIGMLTVVTVEVDTKTKNSLINRYTYAHIDYSYHNGDRMVKNSCQMRRDCRCFQYPIRLLRRHIFFIAQTDSV